MKIKIEFTKKEKGAIADTFDCSLENDHVKGSKGKFGTAIYDPDGEIMINLKTDFILSAIKLIKSFILPYLAFVKEWCNIEEIDSRQIKTYKDLKELNIPIEILNNGCFYYKDGATGKEEWHDENNNLIIGKNPDGSYYKEE